MMAAKPNGGIMAKRRGYHTLSLDLGAKNVDTVERSGLPHLALGHWLILKK